VPCTQQGHNVIVQGDTLQCLLESVHATDLDTVLKVSHIIMSAYKMSV